MKRQNQRTVRLDDQFQDAVFVRGDFRVTEIVSVREIAKKFAEVGLCGELVPGEDPPDFVFVNKQSREKWFIEETQLHEYIQRDDGTICSVEAIIQPLKNLCCTLTEAQKLARNYVLWANVPADLSMLKKQISEFIQTGEKVRKFLDSEKRVEIEGFEGGSSPYSIAPCFYPHPKLLAPNGADRENIRSQVEFAVKDLLAKKKPRLALLREKCCKRILAVYQRNIFAELNLVRDVLLNENVSSNDFDGVLLISKGKDVYDVFCTVFLERENV